MSCHMETLDDCLSTPVCFGISIHIIGKRCIGLLREYYRHTWCPVRDLCELYELSHNKSHSLWLCDTRCWQKLTVDISVHIGSEEHSTGTGWMLPLFSSLWCRNSCIICSWMKRLQLTCRDTPALNASAVFLTVAGRTPAAKATLMQKKPHRRNACQSV